MGRILKIFLTISVATLLVAVLLAAQFNRVLEAPVAVPADGITFEIQPGTAFGQVSDELARRGVIDHPNLFRWYARASGKAARIHAGEYHLASGMSPKELLDKFVAGNVRLYSFTIVEGWTFRELLAALTNEPVVSGTLDYDEWPALLAAIGAGETHPEGLFLPETYRFPKGTPVVDVLRQAYELMQKALAEEWDRRRDALPLATPYEALVLASIVEKETALAAERPRIAGVFVRRLQQRMRLQTDPTVIYGIGEAFDGNLTRRDMRTDTPYNTYTRAGLPPTPIALPGRAAIRAALNPADGTELYFVATGLGDGSHRFSDTREEHDAAVQEYLARQRAARKPQRGQ